MPSRLTGEAETHRWPGRRSARAGFGGQGPVQRQPLQM